MSFAEDPSGWLVLTGPSGSGKTHLAAAIANSVLEAGRPAFFVFVPDLLDHLRSAFTTTSDVSFDQLFEQVRNAPFLVLDDLGGHSGTPWAQEKLYQILNFRYSHRMPTVFTLGVQVEELETRWQTRLTDTHLAITCCLGVPERGGLSGQIGVMKSELLQRMSFGSFNVQGNGADSDQRESLKWAFDSAVNYAKAPDGWLVFLGPTGCGKTHLVHAIVNECFTQVRDVLYFRVADLLDYLRVTYSPESTVTYDRLFEEVRNVPLLILEDFGAHHPTPWAREKLHQILVHRHDARLPTIITAIVFDDKEMEAPIFSRLKDENIVKTIPIDAPDYRYQGRG